MALPAIAAPSLGKCADRSAASTMSPRSEEHTSELQSPCKLVCRRLSTRTETDALSLHDALPIYRAASRRRGARRSTARTPSSRHPRESRRPRDSSFPRKSGWRSRRSPRPRSGSARTAPRRARCRRDRKSTRLNSSHLVSSYAVVCRPAPRPTLSPYTTLFRSIARHRDAVEPEDRLHEPRAVGTPGSHAAPEIARSLEKADGAPGDRRALAREVRGPLRGEHDVAEIGRAHV